MRRWFCFCVYSLMATLLCFAPLYGEAHAAFPRQLTAADQKHAKSAFYFAERGNWFEARQHASKSTNPILRDYMLWRALLNDEGSFSDYHDFLRRNPGWPSEKRLVLKAEDRMFSEERPSPATLGQWFKLHPPVSGKGKLIYAQWLEQQNQNAATSQLVREAWIQGDFDNAQEKAIMLRYANTLRQQDHISRTDRLIWEGKYTPAGRMMFALPKAQQNLFEARILLALNKPGVNNAIARLPASLRNDPGLAYERMKWRERKGLSDGVEELLLAAPAVVPYPEKWWRSRHIRVREALEKHRYQHAMKLLSNHGQVGGIGQADALWLQGWISLVYLKKPAEAYGYFGQLEKAVSYPVSKSRAQYWLGRSAAAMGQPEQAQQWYTAAAQHNTTFYGQLGAAKAHRDARMRLPQTTRPTAAQQQQFNGDPRVRVVYMLTEAGHVENAYPFIDEMMEQARLQTQAQMVAELGLNIKRHDYAVQASKEAMKQHIVLPQTSYPFYRVNFKPIIEEPLMWAITRQESLFNPEAKSSAGATGMMQLLPSTAREVARKNDISYHQSQLNDIMYNLRLGSTYLGSLVNSFDGSYILAIASYNAGPGRGRQWMKEFGHPGKTPEAAIDWIERIPFSETRNYVQRVLENLQVYRAMVTPAQGQNIAIERDLVR